MEVGGLRLAIWRVGELEIPDSQHSIYFLAIRIWEDARSWQT